MTSPGRIGALVVAAFVAGTAAPASALLLCSMGASIQARCHCPHSPANGDADGLRAESCCEVSVAPARPAGVRENAPGLRAAAPLPMIVALRDGAPVRRSEPPLGPTHDRERGPPVGTDALVHFCTFRL